MKPEEFEVYIIPPNFMEGGTLFGGLLKTRNTIEAVILGLAVGVPVLHLPFSLTVRVVILCLTALPLVLLALIGVQALRCRCIYRSKPQDCRRFSVPLRRAAPPEQSRLPALRRGLYAAQAEARRAQSPAHGRITSFRARGNLFLCIGGVNALHGLTDTIRVPGVREVVEAMDRDQMANPNVRKAVLAMRKEVQKIPAFAIQSTHGKPPAREWTITS